MASRKRIDAGAVTIDVEPPMETIEADLAAIGRDLSNMRTPLTTAIKTVLIPSIRENFMSSGRPDRWEPLADATIEKRQRTGTGNTILMETGRLMEGATQFARWDVGTNEAHISNWNQDIAMKAAVHQGGAVATGRTRTADIPARPFLLIQAEDSDKIEEIFLTWMELRARGRWTRA